MNGDTKKKMVCFGKIDIVFPKAEDGLRHTPIDCIACGQKTACLKLAVKGTGGLTIKEEFIDRAYDSGRIGFLERWSRRKMIKRQKKIDGGKS